MTLEFFQCTVVTLNVNLCSSDAHKQSVDDIQDDLNHFKRVSAIKDGKFV